MPELDGRTAIVTGGATLIGRGVVRALHAAGATVASVLPTTVTGVPNLDSLEKQGSEISRHPHASVGRGISWKVTGVHPNRPAEFHEVRHRRGLIMAAPW